MLLSILGGYRLSIALATPFLYSGLKFGKFLSNFNEAQMQFATKVIS
jgi:hypothetical protein